MNTQMAIIGSSLLIGENALWLLNGSNLLWPVALIGLGVYLFLKGRKPQEPQA